LIINPLSILGVKNDMEGMKSKSKLFLQNFSIGILLDSASIPSIFLHIVFTPFSSISSSSSCSPKPNNYNDNNNNNNKIGIVVVSIWSTGGRTAALSFY